MLAASYGLLLHGSGRPRVRAGLNYIAVNLVASSLFLIGVAILYGVTGTLNMADMALKIPLIPVADRGLLHAGVAILGIAFLVKAAMWPLNFWLAPAYAAASAPVAAIFVMLSKVGVYAVLRSWTLLLSTGTADTASSGAALVYGGLATLALAAIAMMTTQLPRRLAGLGIVVSSGTVLAVLGFADAPMVGGALFYMLGSTLAASALFLLGELIERARAVDVAAAIHDDETDHVPFYVDFVESTGPTYEDDKEAQAGQAIPASMAFLGLSFTACALVIAGLPPLPGFLGKFAMLTALLDASPQRTPHSAWSMSGPGWTLLALLIGSSLLATIALSRAGIRYFWAPQDRPAPRLRAIECVPIAALLLVAAALTIHPDPVLRYTRAAAASLLNPTQYIRAVMSATPVPAPVRASRASVDRVPP